MKVVFFRSGAEFRRWLEENHQRSGEVWVGFYKRDSGKGGITYAEALDEALCFGWIDGVRKSIDESSYKIRFTPRKAKSKWSRVNIAHVGRLRKAGRMQPAGLAAFEARSEGDPYSYEQRDCKLDGAYLRQFRANKRAWEFFRAQAPWYQKVTTHYVMSAKKEATQLRRLGILIRDSERGKRIGILAGKKD